MDHTVLLVDDDKNILHGLTRALRRQPYRLYTAQSGEEAMWILKTHELDVIVADEKMPGISGGELLAWVAEHYPAVARIVLTAHATTESAIRAINEGGVCQFFTKPCNHLHLAVAIREALERRELARVTCQWPERSPHQTTTSECLSRDLETLAHAVSNDLREPLQAVACWSGEEPSCKRLDPQASALLERALRAAAGVEQLVTDLLRASRGKAAGGPAAGGIAQPARSLHAEEPLAEACRPSHRSDGDASPTGETQGSAGEGSTAIT